MGEFFVYTPGVDRTMPLFLYLIIGTLIFAYAFCRIYRKGYEDDKPLISQGISYGILVSLLMFIPMAFIRYSVMETSPLSHYLIDAIFRVVQMVILGIIVAKFFGDLTIAERPGLKGGGGD
jgi:hypothetical protein